MFSWQLWCTLLCLLWFYILWSRRRFYRLMFQIPGPMGLPLLGMAHKLLNKDVVLDVFQHYLQKYGNLVFSWLGPIPFLIIIEPQLISDVLNAPQCVNKAIIYKAIDDGAGEGLFSENEPRWSKHRKLLNPAFGHKVLLSFLPIFNEETATMLGKFDKLVGCGEKNLIPLLRSFTLNIAAQTTMGSEVKCMEYIRNNKLVEAYQIVLGVMTDMAVSPWLFSRTVRRLLGKEEHYARAKSQISGLINKLIDSKLEKGSDVLSQPHERNIFLNIAIDLMNRGVFTKKDVEDESGTIVFGAFGTTANTVTYALILLAMFPEYQEKAFEEIYSMFPNTGDFEVTYNDTQNMTYMDLILNESMRILTPVPIVAREVMEDVVLSNGVLIPKGVQIGIDIFHLHRDKTIWGKDADTFNPDHFLPHNMEDKHPYSFIPFTKGIRHCIGIKYAQISVKVALAKLLRNYKFTTRFKFEEIDIIEEVTLEFKTVPLLEVHRRDF